MDFFLRDVTPYNIFIRDNSFSLGFLSEFNNLITEKKYYTDIFLKEGIKYSSPELKDKFFFGNKNSSFNKNIINKSTVYSLGLIFLIIGTLEIPDEIFHLNNKENSKILDRLLLKISKKYNNDFANFIESLLTLNFEERLFLKEIEKIDFFKDYIKNPTKLKYEINSGK